MREEVHCDLIKLFIQSRNICEI